MEIPLELSHETPDKVLCQLYESLPTRKKQGLWPEVSNLLGKDKRWAASHYLIKFKRAFYC